MKLALVFPGQGSQSVGMLDGYAPHPAVRQTLDQAGQVLGQDLWTLAAEGPAEELNRTVNTQPMMLACDVAVFHAWTVAGGAAPAMMAGHSLGEYAALVAAGALQLADALPLVRFRAQAMQDAVPSGVGAMAAIMSGGMQDEQTAIAEACAEAAQGQVVEAVNFNAPGQIVIAGHREAVERAIGAARARGAKRGVMLPVSAPFHSSLLKPAADRLREYLARVAVRMPTLPVLHNVDVKSAGDADGVRNALALQAASPVRWVQTVEAFVAAGITHIVECGPGQVLTGLCRRIAPHLTVFPTHDANALDEALSSTRA
ncbi:MAG: ACP S-malonyltransferase [Betaproteobacteria bacterium]